MTAAPRDDRGDEIRAALDRLTEELLALAERHGPIAGPVRPAQRPYSRALDRVAAIRHGDAAW